MSRRFVMDFERPLVELEEKLAELLKLDVSANPELAAEIEALAAEVERLRTETYTHLSAVGPGPDLPSSRAPQDRSTTSRRSSTTWSSFTVTAPTVTTRRSSPASRRLGGRKVAVLGHRKGTDTKRTCGATSASPHPEGFRKAMRVMRLADKFGLPIVSFLDTAGRYPGIEAEERGQALGDRRVARAALERARARRGRRYRRGRQRRRACHRLRRPNDHAGERVLLGHQPRDVLEHPVQGPDSGEDGSLVPQDDRLRPDGARHRRRGRPGAARRRAPRSGGGLLGGAGRASRGARRAFGYRP